MQLNISSDDNRKNIIGIIPARYDSTRLPGKPLCMINGKSIVQRVYEQAKQANKLFDVCVATDDERIVSHVNNFGGKVYMTSVNHPSGTDRCLEAAEKYISQNKNISIHAVVNIQGDEPFIAPVVINDLSDVFYDENIEIATIARKFCKNEDIFDSNSVKVVVSKSDKALYFSRSVIPFLRNFKTEKWLDNLSFYKHTGIYAYRFDVLKKICRLQQSPLEIAESLEQLRWLENDFSIKVIFTDYKSVSIDSYEDLKRFEV